MAYLARVRTYNRPTMKILVSPTFVLVGICSFQITGTHMKMIMNSVAKSVAVNTVSMLRVLEHCVRNVPIGAQFNFQFVPHWKTVAKKKDMLHMATTTIITQQKIWKDLVAREKDPLPEKEERYLDQAKGDLLGRLKGILVLLSQVLKIG
jgi:hypothetical protein